MKLAELAAEVLVASKSAAARRRRDEDDDPNSLRSDALLAAGTGAGSLLGGMHPYAGPLVGSVGGGALGYLATAHALRRNNKSHRALLSGAAGYLTAPVVAALAAAGVLGTTAAVANKYS